MYEYILDRLPYTSSFRFVDAIISLHAEGVTAEYTLQKDAFFYADHFAGFPVTPGAILTEIMAQAGLVVLGIYLTQQSPQQAVAPQERFFPLLTSADVSFYKMVLPGEKVTVISQKKYFRFNKLKCYIEMLDGHNDLVAKGMFSGMMKHLAKPAIL